MGVEFKFTGDGNQLAGEYDKLVRKVDKLEKQNVKLADAARRAEAGLGKQAAAQEGTFSGAVSGIGKTIAGYVTLQGAISATIGLLREQREEERRASEKGSAAEFDIAKLVQLAPDERSLDKLVNKYREFYGAGGADSQGHAAQAIFSMESAGLLGDFDTFKELSASGAERDMAGLARAVATLQTSLGKEETGEMRGLVSKGFLASAYSPGSVSEMLEATSRSGSSARALGLTDEELLAATALVGKAEGSLDRGGTRMSALLGSVEKMGGFEDKSLMEIVGEIEKKELSPADLAKELGSKEALGAYRTLLSNRDQYQAILDDINQGNTRDVVSERVDLAGTRPELVAARLKRVKAAEAELDLIDEGAIRNLGDSIASDVKKQGRERLQKTYGDHIGTDMMIGTGDFIGGTVRFFQGEEAFIRENANYVEAGEAVKQLDKLRPTVKTTVESATAGVAGNGYLKQIADNTKGARGNGIAGASQREFMLPSE